MKVKDLIRQLHFLPGNSEVVMRTTNDKKIDAVEYATIINLLTKTLIDTRNNLPIVILESFNDHIECDNLMNVIIEESKY